MSFFGRITLYIKAKYRKKTVVAPGNWKRRYWSFFILH